MDTLGERAAAWVGRIRSLFSRRFDDELADEMRMHLELRRQALIDDGMDPRDAEYEARRLFGNPTVLRERSRDAWGFASVASFCAIRVRRAAAAAPSGPERRDRPTSLRRPQRGALPGSQCRLLETAGHYSRSRGHPPRRWQAERRAKLPRLRGLSGSCRGCVDLQRLATSTSPSGSKAQAHQQTNARGSSRATFSTCLGSDRSTGGRSPGATICRHWNRRRRA